MVTGRKMLLEPKSRQINSNASREFNLYTPVMSYRFNTKRQAKKFKHKNNKLTVKESFFMEFAEEIDLLSTENAFPDWVYRFREERLGSIEKNFRRMCRKLKDLGVKFFIHYPIEIGGKWKFADVYLPKRDTIVLLLGFSSGICSPCNVRNDREKWFSQYCRVVSIYPDELNTLGDRLK